MIINLTNKIVRYSGTGLTTFHPSGTVASVMYHREGKPYVNQGIRICCPSDDDTVNLPPKVDGTLFIVSEAVRVYNMDRIDLISPATCGLESRGDDVWCRMFYVNP